MKKLAIFCFALLAVCACKKKEEPQPEPQEAEKFIHYTAAELDSMSVAISERIKLAPKTTTAIFNHDVDSLGKFSYEQYSGAHTAFSANVKLDSIYDENNFKTLKVTRLTDTHECNIIYIHGGAFVYNLDTMHIRYCEALIQRVNANIYMPLYYLAPNGHTNAAMQMFLTLYRELLKEGKPIYIMGDSAGGNLTLCFTLYLKSLGEQLPAAVFPISPLCDFIRTNPEIEEVQKRDIMLTEELVTGAVTVWPDEGIEKDDPLVSPVYGDLEDFPPTLFFIGDADILYPDTKVMHNKLHEANVRTGMLVGLGLWHVACLYDLPCRQQWLDEVVDFIK